MARCRRAGECLVDAQHGAAGGALLEQLGDEHEAGELHDVADRTVGFGVADRISEELPSVSDAPGHHQDGRQAREGAVSRRRRWFDRVVEHGAVGRLGVAAAEHREGVGARCGEEVGPDALGSQVPLRRIRRLKGFGRPSFGPDHGLELQCVEVGRCDRVLARRAGSARLDGRPEPDRLLQRVGRQRKVRAGGGRRKRCPISLPRLLGARHPFGQRLEEWKARQDFVVATEVRQGGDGSGGARLPSRPPRLAEEELGRPVAVGALGNRDRRLGRGPLGPPERAPDGGALQRAR